MRILCFALVANIINCSVDAPDLRPDNVAEDENYNEMESIVEVMLEQVFHIDNAVPEHSEPDDGNSDSFLVKKEVSFFIPFSFQIFIQDLSFVGLIPVLHTENYSQQFHPELIPPPPKA